MTKLKNKNCDELKLRQNQKKIHGDKTQKAKLEQL